jgi:hypothetical protein
MLRLQLDYLPVTFAAMNRNKRGTARGGEQHGYHCFAHACSASNVGNGKPARAEFADTLTLSNIRFAALSHWSIPKNLTQGDTRRKFQGANERSQ